MKEEIGSGARGDARLVRRTLGGTRVTPPQQPSGTHYIHRWSTGNRLTQHKDSPQMSGRTHCNLAAE